MTQGLEALQREMAPAGPLRVGINLSNFLLVGRDAARGEPTGIVPDLARELGRRLDLPVAFVGYANAGEMADAVAAHAWDVAFMGAEPQREGAIAFTPAYVEIPATFLVPPGSPLQSVTEVDRPGTRIAVAVRAAYGLYLERTLKHATLQHANGLDASFDLFVSGGLEALAGLRPKLIADRAKLPGSRVLDGAFTAVRQAVGSPRERLAAAGYLREFVEDLKASGAVARAIAAHGVAGVTVAPAA